MTTPTPISDQAAGEPVWQVWDGDTCSWHDVTPEYYAERLPSNRRILYTAPTTGTAPLLDAAKAFYNATIADTSVIVRPPSAEKRDNIKRLGDELRTALLAASMGGDKS